MDDGEEYEPSANEGCLTGRSARTKAALRAQSTAATWALTPDRGDDDGDDCEGEAAGQSNNEVSEPSDDDELFNEYVGRGVNRDGLESIVTSRPVGAKPNRRESPSAHSPDASTLKLSTAKFEHGGSSLTVKCWALNYVTVTTGPTQSSAAVFATTPRHGRFATRRHYRAYQR
jgi:hypothetical protein